MWYPATWSPHREQVLRVSINNERKTAKAKGVLALERLLLPGVMRGASLGVAMATVNQCRGVSEQGEGCHSGPLTPVDDRAGRGGTAGQAQAPALPIARTFGDLKPSPEINTLPPNSDPAGGLSLMRKRVWQELPQKTEPLKGTKKGFHKGCGRDSQRREMRPPRRQQPSWGLPATHHPLIRVAVSGDRRWSPQSH